MLTRKHFQRLADIAGTIEDHTTRWSVAREMADFCREQNPAFDSGRFHNAVDDAYKDNYAPALLRSAEIQVEE